MAFALLGIVEEVTTCDCCGKTRLAQTVAMETEVGDVVHYGTTCAARALGGRGSRKEGSALWTKALMVQKCRDALTRVRAAMDVGECPRKAAGSRFLVSYGVYSDTGNKMPLRIYFEGWTIPGAEIPANAY
jgi:hypothetical protein